MENYDTATSSSATELSDDDSAFSSEQPCTKNADLVGVSVNVEERLSNEETKTLLVEESPESTLMSHRERWGEWLHSAFGWFLDSYVCLTLLAAMTIALNAVCIKILSASVSVFQIMAIRSSLCSVVLLVLCRRRGISLLEPRKTVPLFLLRGVFGSIAFFGLAFSTYLLPLADSAFITNSYPVVTAVLSWAFRMEELSAVSWAGICGCFTGNALVAHPPFIFGGHGDWGMERIGGVLAAVASNACMGCAFILIRYIGKGVPSIVLPTYMHIFCFVMSIPFLFLGFPHPLNLNHTPRELLCYGGTCLAALCLQPAVTRATQLGPPTKVTSLLMTNMLLSGLVGIAAFSEEMSLISFIGAFIILLSVLTVTLQKPTRPSQQYHLISSSEDVEEVELVVKENC